MRWLTIRLRARRIDKIRSLRLMRWYLEKWQEDHNIDPGEDEEQQASLLTEFEIRRRQITAQDAKRVREARRLELDWQELSQRLEDTRLYRILGWEAEQ